MIRLQTPFQGNSIRVLFACRNQQSLKLYTGFFIPVNKIFTFCWLVDCLPVLRKSLDLTRDSQRIQLALRLLTVISRALDSIPVFSFQSKQIQKNLFFLRSPFLPALTSLKRSFISRAIDYSTAFEGLWKPVEKFCHLCLLHPLTSVYRRSGSSRKRRPVNENSALATAAASGGTPGSPTPPGGRVLSTTCVCTMGAFARLSIGKS